MAGKFPLTAAWAAELPPVLTRRANLVVPRGRGSLFTAVWRHDHRSGPAEDGADYVLWGFADAAGALPPEVETLDGRALQALVTERIPGWSPAFHRLIDGSDPATVNAFKIKSAHPVDPWPTGRVTLLGDAIHNMTPMAGVGANTALRDADLLRRALIAARAGEAPLIQAVSRYEREMLGYGFAAVRRSLRNAQQAAGSTWVQRAAFRTVLRLTTAVPPMRHAMARGLGR